MEGLEEWAHVDRTENPPAQKLQTLNSGITSSTSSRCSYCAGLCEDLDRDEDFDATENEAEADDSEPEYLHEPSRKSGQKSGYFKVGTTLLLT